MKTGLTNLRPVAVIFGGHPQAEKQMALPVSFQSVVTPAADPVSRSSVAPKTAKPESSDIGQRFEQMLWTEMLTYAGLDKAFAQGGGEAASAFSRYVVEAIAKDLAETHPMGLADAVDATIAASQQPQQDDVS